LRRGIHIIVQPCGRFIVIAFKDNCACGLELTHRIDAEFGISAVPDDIAQHNDMLSP
jgi:hypothetical protein